MQSDRANCLKSHQWQEPKLMSVPRLYDPGTKGLHSTAVLAHTDSHAQTQSHRDPLRHRGTPVCVSYPTVINVRVTHTLKQTQVQPHPPTVHGHLDLEVHTRCTLHMFECGCDPKYAELPAHPERHLYPPRKTLKHTLLRALAHPEAYRAPFPRCPLTATHSSTMIQFKLKRGK